jgi:hypothetical protein
MEASFATSHAFIIPEIRRRKTAAETLRSAPKRGADTKNNMPTELGFEPTSVLGLERERGKFSF